MQTKSTHLASLLTLIVIGASLLMLLSIVLVLLVTSLMDLFSASTDAAAGMISAVAFIFLSVLLVVCGWFVLQKARGLEAADQPFTFPFAPWMWIALPALVVFSILLGGSMTLLELPWLNWLILPILTVLVIFTPIWLLFGIVSKGIELGERWRFYAFFSLSMTIAPVIMIVLEMIVLVAIIIAGAVYLSMSQPALLGDLEMLANVINSGTMNEDALLAIMTPYLTNPYVIGVAIGYIAVIVPLIEELLKPLALWLFARKLQSPAQGFAIGALSGAAFALVESLNASSDGTTTWAVIVSVRTGTSVLHMLTSGLVGWGIASAFQERRIGRFLGAYLAAVLIHGIWNASAIGVGITSLGETLGRPEWIFNYVPALFCGLVVLGLGVTALLFVFNRKLRTQIFQKEQVESPA